jgi:hypothetical protein
MLSRLHFHHPIGISLASERGYGDHVRRIAQYAEKKIFANSILSKSKARSTDRAIEHSLHYSLYRHLRMLYPRALVAAHVRTHLAT